jgi:hypothetical protein
MCLFSLQVLCEASIRPHAISVTLLLFTAIWFSPGVSSPYTSTHNTNVFTRWQ